MSASCHCHHLLSWTLINRCMLFRFSFGNRSKLGGINTSKSFAEELGHKSFKLLVRLNRGKIWNNFLEIQYIWILSGQPICSYWCGDNHRLVCKFSTLYWTIFPIESSTEITAHAVSQNCVKFSVCNLLFYYGRSGISQWDISVLLTFRDQTSTTPKNNTIDSCLCVCFICGAWVLREYPIVT